MLVIGQDGTRILDPVTMESLVTVVPVSILGAQDVDVKDVVQPKGAPKAPKQVSPTGLEDSLAALDPLQQEYLRKAIASGEIDEAEAIREAMAATDFTASAIGAATATLFRPCPMSTSAIDSHWIVMNRLVRR